MDRGSIPLLRTVRAKLFGILATIVLLVAALGAVGFGELTKVRTYSTEVSTLTSLHAATQELAVLVPKLDADLERYLMVGGGQDRSAVQDGLTKVSDALSRLEFQTKDDADLEADVAPLVAKTQALLEEIPGLLESVSSGTVSNTQVGAVVVHFAETKERLDQFGSHVSAHVTEAVEAQHTIVGNVNAQMLFTVILALIVAIGAWLFIVQTVRSIGAVTDTALAITRGDLERIVPVHRDDEIGLLAEAFNSMTNQLRELIGDLEARVDRRTAELTESNAALLEEIEERHRIEAELRQAKEFAETVLNGMSDAIAIIDIDTHEVVGANRVYLDGRRSTEVMGLPCYTTSHGESEPCQGPDDPCPLVGLGADGEPMTTHHVHHTPDGETHHVEVSAMPLPDDGSGTRRVVHVSRDITSRKRAEEALKEYATRLEQTIQELGATQAQLVQAQKLEAIGGLAAGVAHEINTPIQYVGDNTRFLQDAVGDLLSLQAQIDRLFRTAVQSAPDAEQLLADYQAALDDVDVEYLQEEIPVAVEQSIEGVSRVAEIVRALKDFAHPGSEEKTPLDLNRVVENTLAVSKNEWKYVAEVVTDLDPSLPAVPAVSGPLGQALLIVVINAAQAISETVDGGANGKGEIAISTRVEDGHAVVSITDTGPGIPAHIRDRIFDHFFTTKDVGKGSGQGLTIARNVIVDQHGGTLTFDTEVGSGTTFHLRLPLDSSATQGRAA